MKKKWIAVGLAVLMTLLTLFASAAEPIGAESTGTMTVTVRAYRGESAVASETLTPLHGVAVYAYRIADIAGTPASFTYTPTDDFAGFAAYSGAEMQFDWDSSEAWDAFAVQIVNYIRSVNGEPIEDGTVIRRVYPEARYYTNANGQVTFEDLPAGLYLVYIAPATVDGYRYEFGTPAFVSVPTVSPDKTIGADTEWEYDVEVNPKPPTGVPETPPDPPEPPDPPTPPTPPTPPDPPTPPTPPDPPTPPTPPDPPTPPTPPDEPPTPPEVPEEPIPDEPTPLVPPEFPEFEDIPDEPTPLAPPDFPEEEIPEPNIPLTGMLWWPVPVLAIGGLFLIIIGLILHRSGKEEND